MQCSAHSQRHRWSGGWLLVVLALNALPALAQVPTDEQAPLAPLSESEMRRAVEVARNDARTVELVGKDARVGTVQFIVPKKPEQALDPDKVVDLGRHAAVYLSSRDTRRGAWVLVDLRAGKVAEARDLKSRDVPFGQEELELAWAIAQRSPEVMAGLGEGAARFAVRPAGEKRKPEREVLGMPIRGRDDNDPCATNRCLALIFRKGRTFRQGVEVVVDLSRESATFSRREVRQ
jgi:hypothetical protein